MITREQLDRVGELVIKGSVLETGSVDVLRGQFPGIHFTYCSDDDVFAAKPVLETKTFNLYLIDSRSHCPGFTLDGDIATGIVVTEVEPEDE